MTPKLFTALAFTAVGSLLLAAFVHTRADNWSTGSAGHAVRKTMNGEITRWPIVEVSLTPTPVQTDYGFMNWFLNTGRKRLPSAPESAFMHLGNGTNLIYVDPENDLLCGDAAEALAGARHIEALEALLAFLRQPIPMSTRRSVLLTLSASPLPESGEYLVSVIESGPEEAAEAALTALGASRFREVHKDRVARRVNSRGGGGY